MAESCYSLIAGQRISSDSQMRPNSVYFLLLNSNKSNINAVFSRGNSLSLVLFVRI